MAARSPLTSVSSAGRTSSLRGACAAIGRQAAPTAISTKAAAEITLRFVPVIAHLLSPSAPVPCVRVDPRLICVCLCLSLLSVFICVHLWPLFVSERAQRIDRRGAACGDVAGDEC